MHLNEKDFKLADYFIPALPEGEYTVKGDQQVKAEGISETFGITDKFYVAANTETISPKEIFSVYPPPEQQGDFSGTLPFIVLNNEFYPWIRHSYSTATGKTPIPWLALIVVSEDEHTETSVKYSDLPNQKEKGVFFPYKVNVAATCKNDDNIYLFTVPKNIFSEIMPSAEDLPWLTHAKYVDLSAAEDSVASQNGWFSTIIANRFTPSSINTPLKSTVHLICTDGYLNADIPADCHSVRLISLHRWSVYSEKVEEKSFVALVNGLGANSSSVNEKSLKPHYLRTGEKTYSLYRSPLLPLYSARYDNINGEGKFTADGRLIYDLENGIFDVSYSAAFNLGRLITLSRRSEAEKIVDWRREEAIKSHLQKLNSAIGLSSYDLEEICQRISENLGGCQP